MGEKKTAKKKSTGLARTTVKREAKASGTLTKRKPVSKTAAKKSSRKKAAPKKIRPKRDVPEDVEVAASQDPFEEAKKEVKGSVPAIVKAMVEKAKQGSCPHAKTLLEMTGAKHMFDEEAESKADQGEPWAKLVLERLGEAEFSEERQSNEHVMTSEQMRG